MLVTLQAYYQLASEAAAAAGGRMVKPIGDAVLLTFPTQRAAEAIAALRHLQERGSALWRNFDERCRIQVKVGEGTVLCGPMGAPGDERFDVVGSALNVLFKAPWEDFTITPSAAALAHGATPT